MTRTELKDVVTLITKITTFVSMILLLENKSLNSDIFYFL